MNPAIPLLLLLTAVGLLFRRHRAGVIWVLLGLSATALLLPALTIPDGIPSPAASLSTVAPWQGHVPADRGNTHLRDITFQIQPWLLFMRSELRAGRLPLWNPCQYAGTPFWSNGQSAVLFPLHLLFALLPLQIGLVLLPWLRFMAAGMGTWLLAKEVDLEGPGALLASLIFPLSGMLTSYLLFPMGNALCLVPWILWAVERMAVRPGGWRVLALIAGLQFLAGHPETVIHTFLLATLYLAVRVGITKMSLWCRYVAAWGVAALVAAVQLLPLAFTLLRSPRWGFSTPPDLPPLSLLLQLPLRLGLPDLFGNPADGTWWGPFNYPGTSVYTGIIALILVFVGLARIRSDRRWFGLFILLVAAFGIAYHLPAFRHIINLIPFMDRVLHHRMIFGVEIMVALFAGAGLDRWMSGRSGGIVAGVAVALSFIGISFFLYHQSWSDHGLMGQQTARLILTCLVAAVLLGLRRLSAGRLRAAGYGLIVVAALDLLVSHGRMNPGLSLQNLYPSTPAVRYLQGRPGRCTGLGFALMPNAAMVYGLHDIRGDDPVRLDSYEEAFRLAPVNTGPVPDESWLDRLSLRWVLADPGMEPPVSTWRKVYAGDDGVIFERESALPIVRWASGNGGAGTSLEVLQRMPGRWKIRYAAEGAGTLVVGEVFTPGWRVEVGEETAVVQPFDGLLLGVPVAPGEGTVTLRYRPRGWVVGMVLSLMGIICLITGCFLRFRGQ